ncbi:hypothetical protein N0V83_005432 [Neocucurbitaria cava]|uniref:Transcription factor domain-containing protein n=1 Tax=Neocucurbitaria cava TaxID=798079 RepID=A0A9W9CM11_9PLEO|nr:hypothetical protein N0V83_005432 [Neocucurbitaria cava]
MLESPESAGGDTLVSSSVAQFNALSPRFRKRLEGLTAVHSNNDGVSQELKNGEAAVMRRKELIQEHPVVIVHPVTGEKALYVNPVYTKYIVGFDQEESDYLLGFLFDHIAKRQDLQCRVRYEAGTVLVWDQRVTTHSQTLDYPAGERRHGFRLTPLANKPIPSKVEEDDGDGTPAAGYALAEEGTRRHLVEFIDQEDLRDRPIDKEARISYVGTDVSNINFLVRQTDQSLIVHHFATNRIERRFTAHEPDRIPAEVFELPEKVVVDQLLEAYFEKINPGFPVIDKDRFLKQYQARNPSDPPSLLLLHAMLMVGAHVLEGRDGLEATFFRRAKILIDSRFERNRDVVVQAALLLTWHSDGPEDVAANAWHWIGVATRLALGLGMHRDAEPSTLVEYNKKMWRRVWWLLVQCDLLIALQYGRPLAM